MTMVKSSKITGQVTIKVVDTKGRAIPNATVTGIWSGAFTGSVSSKTAYNGVAVQKSNAIPLVTGASGTYTLDSISASGYAYDPTKNAKTVITMTW
jgi:protocatechuate 3,4-dioxygenase beta subunit